MINFSFRISNPFNNEFKIIWHKFAKFNDKFGWESQLNKCNVLASFNFEIRTNCDHAGVHLSTGLLGFETSIDIYSFAHKD
jgi:hypothetical protein